MLQLRDLREDTLPAELAEEQVDLAKIREVDEAEPSSLNALTSTRRMVPLLFTVEIFNLHGRKLDDYTINYQSNFHVINLSKYRGVLIYKVHISNVSGKILTNITRKISIIH